MTKEDLKIVFMGTPEFAKCSLEQLVDNNFNVVACFTNPDSKSGRGMKFQYSEVKKYAIEKNIDIYQPLKLRNNDEIYNILKEINPNLIVVVAYGKILPKNILDIPKYGCINVHGSLLPKYRGAAPMQWAIINGEKTTGITTMFMNEGMDTGDMLLKQEVEILREDNFETIHDKMKEVGANLLIKTIEKLLDGTLKSTHQDDTQATFAPMITKDNTKISFEDTCVNIFNQVRGLSPIPGCSVTLDDGSIYKVYNVDYEEKNKDEIRDIPNGKIVLQDKKNLKIKCRDGYISILRIQPPNSKKMDISAFLAGKRIDEERLFI